MRSEMRSSTARVRSRAAVLSGAIAALLSAGVLAAGPANASDEGVYSYTSSKGGYGFAHYTSDASGYGATLRACDRGTPDGLRAVAEVWRNSDGGGYYEVSDANGSNGDCVSAHIPEPAKGQYMKLRSCLRDRATGYDQYCRTITFVLT
ncbi:hypothetical protein ACFV80_38360 [Streptomyces sp. NPDC059862]|uniref:hypothetical protein n=1 Tax=Streptomyces sp. NPDC059862 TaxID=3346975 RepID=UPI0036598D1D